ncbi:hypothetical protein NXX36_20230 [Bacteroides fragilis]|uniref:hypothetical protein n=1 Tax=Bacteroides TaxID=816 RepID=UPI0015862322|nr:MULTISPECIES: hypothetical protein [Bacteroides]MBV4152521.1 hypothetical protein [Bacteroides fragilis]MCE8578100.1 hypothetical protein [Bacteroides fragilis]MCE8650764.1 hypothetical protein [Bacteroides fragilis]MCM0348478.1 hypothetical protein [Bacteroides fragilis]MCM0368689.1 hypothetical protein [Bacteroides fragilis]
MNNKYYKQLATIVTFITQVVLYLFLLGYLYPIERGTPQGGITGAIGVGIIIFISFGILILLRFLQKK